MGAHEARQYISLIDPDWKKSVKTIVEAGRLLIMAKNATTYGEFKKMIILSQPVGMSAIAKLMSIGENKILSDPKNYDKLPAGWVTLYLISCLPGDKVVKFLADGTINKYTNKYSVRTMRAELVKSGELQRRYPSSMPRVARLGGDGNRMHLRLPPGKTILEIVAQGIEWEKRGIRLRSNTTGTTAKADLGIGYLSYQRARDIVLLSQRDDLNKEDAAVVNAAMKELKEPEFNLLRLFKSVKPIIARVWNPKIVRIKAAPKPVSMRKEAFMKGVMIIHDSCESLASNDEMPHLGGVEVYYDMLRQLRNAHTNIRKLIKLSNQQVRLFDGQPMENIDDEA